jgi:fluoride ion exporter CrcB/FEX
MGGNFTNFLSDAVGATNQGIDMVVGATTGVVTTAARNTPGLKKFVTPNVHAGFWEAYTVVRGFVHGVLRAELMRRPTTVIFTGHSLGGALATFASLDFKITSLPRINAYLRHQAKYVDSLARCSLCCWLGLHRLCSCVCSCV